MISLLFPFIVSASIGWFPPQAQAITTNDEAIAYASEVFKGTPLLAVAKCESHLQQWDDEGNVLQGKENHDDVGLVQINQKYHFAEAYKLGYDILTAYGNINYARHLYDEQGLAPWKASKACWSK